jgi:DNA-binding Xre family transcriptional regulator
MLKYNLERLLIQRGIGENPLSYLMKHGFSRGQASRLLNNKVSSIQPENIEKLCYTFKCTPNDLMEWTPKNEQHLKENQQLMKLLSNNASVIDWRSVNADIPFEKIPELVEKINEIKKSMMGK